MAGWRAITCLAIGITLGLGLLVLGCALQNQWEPFSLLIVYALLPLPIVGCGIGLSDPMGSIDNSAANGWRQFGLFIEGVLLVSALGIPLVLYHVATISGATFAFTIVSGIVLLLSLASFVGVTQAGSSGTGFFAGW